MKKKLLIFLVVAALIGGAAVLVHFDVTYRGKKAVCDYWNYTWSWIKFDENNAANRYDKKLDEMLDELGSYDSYDLTTRKRNQLMLFQSHGMALVGNYSEENYQKQKNYILDNYEFASKTDEQIFKYELDDNCAFEFDINKWHFMLLNENDEYYYIPEYFRVVGFNNTDKK